MARARRPRTRANILQGFDVFVARLGLDYDRLLEECSIDAADLGNPDNLISLNAVARLLTLTSEKSGDPCLGLHWAEAYSQKATGILGYLLLNASSVRDAVKAVERYVSLVMDPIDVDYKEDEAGGRLTARFPPEFDAPRIQYISFAMGLLICRLRKHAGKNWMPVGVDLEHRELPCRETVLRVLGPNVRFNKAANTLHIRELVLDRASDDVDRHLYELIRQLGERLLAEQGPSADIVQRIRKIIIDQLDTGAVRVREVAETAGMSPSTLQSRLSAAGTTYEEVLTTTRRSLADLYLRDTELPLTEIAFMLGFSELSAFTRAAQRWYGAPPSQRRVELRM